VAALLHRGEAERERRGHRLQSGRFRRARQQRPGRQVCEHRQPLRAVHRKRFDGKLGDHDPAAAKLEHDSAFAAAEIGALYEAREFGKAVRRIMELADAANQYVDSCKPWELAKNPAGTTRLHCVCTSALILFRDLTVYLAPILPDLADKVAKFLGVPLSTGTR
jgi:methionyl-tRNA synthetase